MKLAYDIYVMPKGCSKSTHDTLIATAYMLAAAIQIVENMRGQLQSYEPYLKERRVE